MTVSLFSPADILSRLQIAGNPWHGVVQGGVLTLPNAQTRPVTQPGGNRWYMAGRSILVQRPGWIGPERSTAELASDDAAGRQWLPYSLISGDNAMFYGKPLGEMRWIYIDQAGDRWLCELVIPPGWHIGEHVGDPVTIKLRRFGEFGVPDETHDYNVTVPDLGQASPASADFGTAGQWSLRLMDVLPDGSGALFMLYYSPSFAGQYVQDVALGFLEVTLSGAGGTASVGLYLRRTRAQCVGTIVDDDKYPGFGGPTNDDNYAAEIDAPSRRLIILVNRSTSDSGSDYPACTGEQVVTVSIGTLQSQQWVTVGGPIEFRPSMPTSGSWKTFVWEYSAVSATPKVTRTGVILSMYYKPDGTLAEITMDHAVEWDCQLEDYGEPTGSTATFRRQRTGVSGGACTYEVMEDTTGTLTLTRTAVIESSLTITLKSDGVECYTNTWTSAWTIARSWSIEYRASLSSPAVLRGTKDVTETITTDPGATTVTLRDWANSGGGDWQSWDNFEFLPASGDSGQVSEPRYEMSPKQPYSIIPQINLTGDWGTQLSAIHPYRWFGNYLRTSGNIGENIRAPAGSDTFQGRMVVTVARMAPSIITVCESYRPPVLGASYVATWPGEMATADGPAALADMSDTASSSSPFPNMPLHASRQPVTGAFARAFGAVCWV